MATSTADASSYGKSSSKFLQQYGWDLLLGSIAAFYVFAVPYTKVEESFNVQAIHDIIHHRFNFNKCPSSLTFNTTYGIADATLTPAKAVYSNFSAPSAWWHFIILIEILPPSVNVAYAFWLKGSFLATLRCLIFAMLVFRCDMLLLLGPIGLGLLLRKSISLTDSVKCCISTVILCIGLTLVVDSIMWQRFLWPELEVFWFNTILNRSSEWGTQPYHWYFSSALPRSLLVAYPLCLLGVLLDQRTWEYFFPVLSFVVLYSKLAHKELRFIFSAIPIFNLCAAVAFSRFYHNRKKNIWRWLYIVMVGSFLVSLGFSGMIFMASYNNYPSANALNVLHRMRKDSKDTSDKWVHIDTFAAINGISRFCENDSPWRYSKEEGIPLSEYQHRNFTYLLNEHPSIEGYACLFVEYGFASVNYRAGFPPIQLLKKPKVYVHGRNHIQLAQRDWPGCS